MDGKTRKQLIFVACLLPVLLLAWLRVAHRTHRASAPAPAGSAASLPKPPETSRAAARSERIRVYEVKPWRKNPFFKKGKPIVPPPEEHQEPVLTPTFHLEGIVWDVDYPFAIIDGEVRALGDTVLSYEVIGITQDTVTLRKGDQVLDLKLFPELR